MSIKQIERDIAEGRYVNPAAAAATKLENIQRFTEIQLGRSPSALGNLYTEGYKSALRDIMTLLKGDS